MSLRQSLLSALITLSLWSSFVFGDTENKTAAFTIQVAAFPENAESEAEEYVAKLAQAGEQPVWGLIEIPGKGQWLRVYLGSFQTATAARQYGMTLLTRHIIKEFVVKKSSEMKMLSRPRSVIRKAGRTLQIGGAELGNAGNLSTIIYVEKPLLKQSEKTLARNSAKPPPDPLHPPPAGNRSPTAKHTTLSTHLLTGQSSRPVTYQTMRSVATSHEHSYGNLFNSNLSTISAARPVTRLPQFTDGKLSALRSAPAVDLHSIPRADPLQVAFAILANKSSVNRGGLWLSGDRREGLERLRWIVGKEYADALQVDADGKVQLDAELLVKTAKIKETEPVVAPLLMLDAIRANEGLLLLVQLTQGAFRYRLHLGQRAATSGDEVGITGSINLDNNYDSRINPYRQSHRKLAVEKPPFGFDALIAINPEARWFNLRSQRIVPVGNITFHELAEAYAKVELGYEYLPKDVLPGAHNMAIEREIRLQSQRPYGGLVLTIGSNRVLKSEEELRQFYADPNGARQQ
jgi:hypothetical protein